ncbi:MAG TPA: 2OG-Fe(II) oxygenase [Flavobacteriales bacterium]|jgi:Rps23 Pro-64 3,4-dihydroxylase Tpa1-like proline 4-hydroxylase|nr:2OG-Fe(II) oxygenase [Flavobacteriales bacterium]
MSTATATRIIDLDRWEAELPRITPGYQQATPFPYTSLENFLDADAASQAEQAFPKVQDEGWIHYVHVNEKKHGLNKMDRLPPYLRQVLTELNSDRFVSWLEKLTGIQGLKADDMLEGGGLHQSQRGGFLNIHADFTVHPHKRHWKRRVNVLVYLNKDWQESWGGELELWARDMSKCEARILPMFNRCVIFNTDEDSYHGLPDPIRCPEDQTRKSIALYYFTEEKNAPRLRTTNYRARPTDGLKSLAIWLDKQAVAGYTRVKRTFGLNDDFMSNLLNKFGGKRR